MCQIKRWYPQSKRNDRANDGNEEACEGEVQAIRLVSGTEE